MAAETQLLEIVERQWENPNIYMVDLGIRVDALILVGDIVMIKRMSNVALASWSKVRSMAIAGICRWMNHVL